MPTTESRCRVRALPGEGSTWSPRWNQSPSEYRVRALLGARQNKSCGLIEITNWKLEKGEEKDRTLAEPASMSHLKAFSGIKARPRAQSRAILGALDALVDIGVPAEKEVIR